MPWTLAQNPGRETVYAQFRAVGGTIVGSAEASINLVPATTPTLTLSTTSLTAELAALQAQLAALLKQAGEPAAAPTSPHFVFTRSLTFGMTGNDIKQLQAFLAQNPALYPEAKVTGYFGTLTLKAVKRFQKKYGIAQSSDLGYGTVGPLTRAELNALITQDVRP